MKLEKGIITALVFVGSLVVLLLFSYILTGFKPGTQLLIASVYFSLWITLVVFLWLTVVGPYLATRKASKKTPPAKPSTGGAANLAAQASSPRANLPLRDRIEEYVALRRREDGLPEPQPLRPSRQPSKPAVSSSSVSSESYVSPAAGVAAAAIGAAAVSDEVSFSPEDTGDLPLPDDFDEEGGSGFDMPDSESGFPELPGIDDDMELGGGIGDEDLFEDEMVSESESEEPPAESGGLPDFEGDLEPDLTGDELSGGDDFDSYMADEDMPFPESDAGEEGPMEVSGDLPDFDGSLEPDMSDTDLSGDEDLDDIEFEDLEPDES